MGGFIVHMVSGQARFLLCLNIELHPLLSNTITSPVASLHSHYIIAHLLLGLGNNLWLPQLSTLRHSRSHLPNFEGLA